MKSVLSLTLVVCLLESALPATAQEQTEAVGQTTSHNFSQDLLQKAVAREASRLADTIAPAPLQQRPRQRSWAGRHPVLLGALIGAGIGVGYGAITSAPACEYEFPCKSILGLLGAVFGGAAGFVVGLR